MFTYYSDLKLLWAVWKWKPKVKICLHVFTSTTQLPFHVKERIRMTANAQKWKKQLQSVQNGCFSLSNVQILKFDEEIKNAPSALFSYISTREFLRTREKCALLACLYNSTMHEEQVFYFFYNEIDLIKWMFRWGNDTLIFGTRQLGWINGQISTVSR